MLFMVVTELVSQLLMSTLNCSLKSNTMRKGATNSRDCQVEGTLGP